MSALLLCTLKVSLAFAAPPAAPTAPIPGAAPLNTLAQGAKQIGIKQCLDAVARLSSFALQGSKANDVLLDWDHKQPDAGPMFGLSGIQYPNGALAFSLSAVPSGKDACTVMAERVSVAPFTCQSIATQELAGYQLHYLLPTFSVYTDPKDPNSTVSLIDSPPGCLIIRRYVQFAWKPPAFQK